MWSCSAVVRLEKMPEHCLSNATRIHAYASISLQLSLSLFICKIKLLYFDSGDRSSGN